MPRKTHRATAPSLSPRDERRRDGGHLAVSAGEPAYGWNAVVQLCAPSRVSTILPSLSARYRWRGSLVVSNLYGSPSTLETFFQLTPRSEETKAVPSWSGR